jgi:hypothetical protein
MLTGENSPAFYRLLISEIAFVNADWLWWLSEYQPASTFDRAPYPVRTGFARAHVKENAGLGNCAHPLPR